MVNGYKGEKNDMVQVTDVSNLGVPVLIVFSAIYLFLSAYNVLQVKKSTGERQAGDNALKIELDQLRKEFDAEKINSKERLEEYKRDLNEAFQRIRDLENVQNVLKTEHDLYCKQYLHNGDKNG